MKSEEGPRRRGIRRIIEVLLLLSAAAAFFYARAMEIPGGESLLERVLGVAMLVLSISFGLIILYSAVKRGRPSDVAIAFDPRISIEPGFREVMIITVILCQGIFAPLVLLLIGVQIAIAYPLDLAEREEVRELRRFLWNRGRECTFPLLLFNGAAAVGALYLINFLLGFHGNFLLAGSVAVLCLLRALEILLSLPEWRARGLSTSFLLRESGINLLLAISFGIIGNSA